MFAEATRYWDELTVQAMDRVITGGLGAQLGMIRGALMIYVLIMLVMLMAGPGVMTLWGFIKDVVRAMAVVTLLQAATFNRYVRDLFWVELPNLIASSVRGGTVSITAAERFDLVKQASDHGFALIEGRLSMWTVVANFRVSIAQAACEIFLAFSYALWMISRIATGVLICAGAFLIILYLFSGTRHIVMGWVSRLAGLAVWSLCSAILIEMILGGSLFWARRVAQTVATTGVTEAVNSLMGLAAWYFICAAVMFAMPILAAFPAASAAATSVGGGMMIGAAAQASRVGSNQGRAFGRAAARQISRIRGRAS